MGYFPQTIAAALAGEAVRASMLVHFEFATTPMRLWLGDGVLDAGGETWQGLGRLGSISGLEQALNGTAPMATFTLSGVEPSQVAVALDSSDEVKGRPVTVYLQAFGADWQTLDEPYAVYSGVLDQIRIQTKGPTSRVVEVTAESLFARRGLPPFGYLTDRDQQRLYPGDRGLEQVPTMANKTVAWPMF